MYVAGKYIIAPTEDYVLAHSGMHKYIDKIKTAAGKWRYIYSEAANKVKKGVSNIERKLRKKKTTNKGNPNNQYSPNLKTVSYDHMIASPDYSNKRTGMHSISKGLAESDSRNPWHGSPTSTNSWPIDRGIVERVTNRTVGGTDYYTRQDNGRQYTPSYNTKKKTVTNTTKGSTSYSPSYKTKKTVTNNTKGSTSYSPTAKTKKTVTNNTKGTTSYNPNSDNKDWWNNVINTSSPDPNWADKEKKKKKK